MLLRTQMILSLDVERSVSLNNEVAEMLSDFDLSGLRELFSTKVSPVELLGPASVHVMWKFSQ